MAVGQYLPPVVSRLTMNIDDFVGGIAKAKTALNALKGGVDIPVTADTAAAQAKIAAFNDVVKGAAGAQQDFANATRDTTTALLYQSSALDLVNSGLSGMNRRLTNAIMNQAILRTAVRVTNDALDRQAAAGVAAGLGVAGARAAGGGGGGGGWGLFGIPLTATTLHWIVAGGAEILAVTVPALIALGAAAAVAAEGATNIYTHMQSVYTATEATSNMFHVTAGQAIGLKGALQAAQTAADPSIYGILGSAVLTVNEHFGALSQTGLGVIRTFQTFSARVVSDFAPGGPLGSATDALLAHMQSDLTGIGQLFGNLGHGILTFASQMPGLAEVLLRFFSDFTGWVAEGIDFMNRFRVAGMSLLTVFMIWEEANRWGGLLVSLLSRMGLALRSTNLDANVLSWTHFRGIIASVLTIIPSLIGQLGRLLTAMKLTSAGGALQNASRDMLVWAAGLSNAQFLLIGLGAAAAVGLGIVIDKIVTAQSATQKFVTSLQNAVNSSTNVNVTQTLLDNIGLLDGKIKTATQSVNTYGQSWEKAAKAAADNPASNSQTVQHLSDIAHASQAAQNQVSVLTAAQKQQTAEMVNVQQGAAYLATTYKTNLTGALALADLAGVKLSNGIMGTGQAATVARLQIASLVQGYTSMGQPLGVVGSDMTALAIQSALANTQVSKLNSAWDDFMTNLTGGTSGLASFVTSISNIGNVAATTANNLGTSSGVSLSVSQFASSLKSFNATGSAAWTNFDQVVGSTMPQLIDWMRIAGAEGALSGRQFTRGVLGMASSVMQLAAQSPTAQAELLGIVHEADPAIKTWGQLNQAIKSGKVSLNDTTGAIEVATQKMGNMAQVAQNLGNVLQSALLTSLSQAKIQASGASADMLAYEQAIRNGTAATAAGQSIRQRLINDLKFLGYNAKEAQQLIDMVAGAIKGLQSKTVTITVKAIGNGLSLVTNSGIPGSVGSGVFITGGSVGIRNTKTGKVGYASGTEGAARGWAWVGERGPELVKFSGGERVIPSHIATGYAGGTGGGDSVHEIHVYLDGRKIYKGVQKQAVTTQRRTGANGLAKRTR